MKHVRMTRHGRGPLHTYYYLEWMYDQMRHGEYGTSYSMWYDIANVYVQCWARERSSGRKRKEYIKKIHAAAFISARAKLEELFNYWDCR